MKPSAETPESSKKAVEAVPATMNMMAKVRYHWLWVRFWPNLNREPSR